MLAKEPRKPRPSDFGLSEAEYQSVTVRWRIIKLSILLLLYVLVLFSIALVIDADPGGSHVNKAVILVGVFCLPGIALFLGATLEWATLESICSRKLAERIAERIDDLICAISRAYSRVCDYERAVKSFRREIYRRAQQEYAYLERDKKAVDAAKTLTEYRGETAKAQSLENLNTLITTLQLSILWTSVPLHDGEDARLEQRLKHGESIIEIHKKVSEILGSPLVRIEEAEGDN